MKKSINISILLSLCIMVLSCCFSTSLASAGNNPYPYWQTFEYNNQKFTTITCTYYAWQHVYDSLGIELPSWGKGGDWLRNAQAWGYPTGRTPAANSIVVWEDSGTGHVGYVTSVDGSSFVFDEGGTANSRANSIGIYEGHPYPDGYTSAPTGFIYLEDNNPPVVNVARIQNRTSEGYDVIVEATDNIGVSKIKIGTWHSRMNIDNAIWNEAVPNQNGRAEFHVSYNQFSNIAGAEFYTNAYAWDAAGNVSTAVRCYNVEDLGDDFYATIIWDSSGGFWENDGNRIKISDSSGNAFDTDPKHIWHFVTQNIKYLRI